MLHPFVVVTLRIFLSMIVFMPLCSFGLCVFFFSSRRRHTRCLSDWSSDVCSSDLSVLESRLSRAPARRLSLSRSRREPHLLLPACDVGERRRPVPRQDVPLQPRTGRQIGRASCRERMDAAGRAVRETETSKDTTRT